MILGVKKEQKKVCGQIVLGSFFQALIAVNILLFFLAESSQARVFSFEGESVAPYIGLRSGLSSMGSKPFEWQSATSYSGDDIDLLYGGEFGIYLRGESLGVSFGILVHKFDPVTAGVGTNAGGTNLFSVDMDGLAYGPNILFDYQFSRKPGYMWKFIIGGGYQFAKMESEYTFTATGQALVGGQTTLTESYKSDSPFAVMGVATEFMMSGTTTISLLFGYHYNFNKQWKYYGGGRNLAGVHSDGDSVLFEDGSAKELDWSYPFLQLGFQFYVDTVR